MKFRRILGIDNSADRPLILWPHAASSDAMRPISSRTPQFGKNFFSGISHDRASTSFMRCQTEKPSRSACGEHAGEHQMTSTPDDAAQRLAGDQPAHPGRPSTRAKAGDSEGLHYLYVRYADDVLRYVDQLRPRPPRGRRHHPERLRQADESDQEVRAARGSLRRLDPAGRPQRRPRPPARQAGDPDRGGQARRHRPRPDRPRPRPAPCARRWKTCPRTSARCSSCATSSASRRSRSPAPWTRPRARCTAFTTAAAARCGPAWPSSARRRWSPPPAAAELASRSLGSTRGRRGCAG